ncbi:MAG: dockerin type I domain-containing protein, partial [Gemmatimonadales bacterium]
MKRLLVLLALLGALAAPGRLAAQQIHVGLGGQLSSVVNVPIVIPIVADLTGRSEKLGSYSLRLQWDTLVLRITGGADGTFGSPTVNQDSLAFGILRMAGVNPAGASGLITLVNIQLLPLVKATTTLKFTLTGLYAAGTFADLLPSAVWADGIYCPARGLWGDIDGDGNANSRDALIALSNAVGLDVSAFDIGLGDVNGDGQTNATDALIILSNAVGVDVSRFRVLRIAGGCGSSNAAIALSITPTAADTLIKGQSVQFEAWAADSATGALQSVANPTWKSSAPMVLVIGPDGKASARDTGTAVVTALRGTRDSAQTTVHIIARRTSHWVDAAAVNAKNRLGTTNLPFGSIEEGQQFAQDGDTLRIRLGRYEIANGTLNLSRPIVLIGDTAADGSRPVLAPDSSSNGYDQDAIDIGGAGRFEVQNLAFSGVYYGVYVYGADCVLLRGVRMQTYREGVYLDSPAHCLRIERSVILGPELPYEGAPPVHSPVARSAGSAAYYSNSGPGVDVEAPLDTLTIEDTEIGGFDYGVMLWTQPDSTTIRRSHLHDFNFAAVTTYSDGGPCYGEECPSPPARPAARPRPVHGTRAGVARSAMDGMSPPVAVV